MTMTGKLRDMFWLLFLLLSVPYMEAATIPNSLPKSPSKPTPTWVVKIGVGSSNFMIGDYDKHDLIGLIKAPCDSVGCDPTAPQEFQFNRTESGGITAASGTLTMDGNIDKSESVEHMLLSTINMALLKTSTCKTVSAFYSNPDFLGVPGDTGSTIQVRQCHVASFIQASLYKGPDIATSGIMAHMSMLGASTDRGSLSCKELLGDIKEALGRLNLPSFVAGGVTIAKAGCL